MVNATIPDSYQLPVGGSIVNYEHRRSIDSFAPLPATQQQQQHVQTTTTAADPVAEDMYVQYYLGGNIAGSNRRSMVRNKPKPPQLVIPPPKEYVHSIPATADIQHAHQGQQHQQCHQQQRLTVNGNGNGYSPQSHNTFSPRSPVAIRGNHLPVTPITPEEEDIVYSARSPQTAGTSRRYEDVSTPPISASCTPSRSQATPFSRSSAEVHVQKGKVSPLADSTRINIGPRRTFKVFKCPDIVQKNYSVQQLVEFDLLWRLMTDQSGSRYLQKLLKDNNNSLAVPLMIDYCVYKHKLGELDLVKISEDVYGNYIVQLWFMQGAETKQRLLLDTFINDNFLKLSQSMYGCRVIQRCLKCVNNEAMLCKMVKCMDEQTKEKDNLHECLVCPYTNHVIQAILDLRLECDENIAFIKHALEANLTFYCEHVFGCRVIQCFVKNYGDKLNVLLLLNENNHLYLSKLKYGNYVIQCIIDKGEWYSETDRIRRFRSRLIEDVFHMKHILYLSKNKFGSNVVEKCIEVSNRKQKNSLVYLLSSNYHVISTLIRHCYGNYVVKALLAAANKKNQCMLMKSIRFCCPNIKDKSSGGEQNKFCKDLMKEIERIESTHH